MVINSSAYLVSMNIRKAYTASIRLTDLMENQLKKALISFLNLIILWKNI